MDQQCKPRFGHSGQHLQNRRQLAPGTPEYGIGGFNGAANRGGGGGGIGKVYPAPFTQYPGNPGPTSGGSGGSGVVIVKYSNGFNIN